MYKNNDTSDSESQRKNEILLLTKKKSVSRSLLHELLTDDDESENETDGLNRLFLSKTSQKSNVKEDVGDKLNTDKSNKTSTQLMDKLQISDSDVTNCSEYELAHSSLNVGNNDDSINRQNLSKMEHLFMSDVDADEEPKQSSESLFSTNDKEEDEKNKNNMEILSAQVKQLGIKSPPDQKAINIENQCYEKRISEADTLSMTTTQHISSTTGDNEHKITNMQNKQISVLCPLTPPFHQWKSSNNYNYNNDSIYTISSDSSSTSNETINVPETDNDDGKNNSDDGDDDSDIIIISDSNSETSSPNLQISEALDSKRTLSLPSSEDNIKEELLKEFLDNIPLVQPGIECLSSYDSLQKLSSVHHHLPKVQNLKEENESMTDTIEMSEKSFENDIKRNEDLKQSEINLNENRTPENSNENQASKKSAENENTESVTQESDMRNHVEKINISATIKIKFQIKEPTITYTITDSPPPSNDNQSENNDSNENKNDQNVYQNKSKSVAKTEINDENLNDNSFEIRTRNNVDLKRKEKNVSNEKFENFENNSYDVQVDNMAKNLLTKLYGNEWKTPEVIQKLDKTLSIKKNDTESSLNDFTKFRRNILPDLQSTKLKQTTFMNDDLEDLINFKKPLVQMKPIKEDTDSRENKENEENNGDEQRNVETRNTGKKRLAKIKPKRVYCIQSSSDDSANENEKDFSADSDVSWYASDNLDSNSSFLSDTDSDDSLRERKNSKSTKKKQSNKIIYLDLTNDYIKVQKKYKSPPAEKDEAFREKLENILKASEYKEKPKVPITPVQSATKTKRKLYTPKYDDEHFDIELENNIQKLKEYSFISNSTKNEYKESVEDDIGDSVKLKYLLPSAFNLINKQIESVKTDTPIAKMKTPRKEFETPQKEFKTPITKQKGYSARKETPDLKNCGNLKIPLPDKISSTPSDKYGFLRSLDVYICKSYCHPEALYYRENFKTKKHELTLKLYNLYNEEVFYNKLNLNITWSKRLLTTAGVCIEKKVLGERCCRIELSEKVITSADRLRCTLIHELCHAATWVFDGGKGHDAVWRKWTRRANNIFPELPEIKVCHKYNIEYKYTYMCTLCRAKSYAHSKSKKTENIRCAYCHGAIEVYLTRKNKEGEVMYTPVREPKGFAKFVKENYKLYKTPDRKHGDVMKLLSSKFSSLDVKDK